MQPLRFFLTCTDMAEDFAAKYKDIFTLKESNIDVNESFEQVYKRDCELNSEFGEKINVKIKKDLEILEIELFEAIQRAEEAVNRLRLQVTEAATEPDVDTQLKNKAKENLMTLDRTRLIFADVIQYFTKTKAVHSQLSPLKNMGGFRSLIIGLIESLYLVISALEKSESDAAKSKMFSVPTLPFRKKSEDIPMISSARAASMENHSNEEKKSNFSFNIRSIASPRGTRASRNRKKVTDSDTFQRQTLIGSGGIEIGSNSFSPGTNSNSEDSSEHTVDTPTRQRKKKKPRARSGSFEDSTTSPKDSYSDVTRRASQDKLARKKPKSMRFRSKKKEKLLEDIKKENENYGANLKDSNDKETNKDDKIDVESDKDDADDIKLDNDKETDKNDNEEMNKDDDVNKDESDNKNELEDDKKEEINKDNVDESNKEQNDDETVNLRNTSEISVPNAEISENFDDISAEQSEEKKKTKKSKRTNLSSSTGKSSPSGRTRKRKSKNQSSGLSKGTSSPNIQRLSASDPSAAVGSQSSLNRQTTVIDALKEVQSASTIILNEETTSSKQIRDHYNKNRENIKNHVQTERERLKKLLKELDDNEKSLLAAIDKEERDKLKQFEDQNRKSVYLTSSTQLKKKEVLKSSYLKPQIRRCHKTANLITSLSKKLVVCSRIPPGDVFMDIEAMYENSSLSPTEIFVESHFGYEVSKNFTFLKFFCFVKNLSTFDQIKFVNYNNFFKIFKRYLKDILEIF